MYGPLSHLQIVFDTAGRLRVEADLMAELHVMYITYRRVLGST